LVLAPRPTPMTKVYTSSGPYPLTSLSIVVLPGAYAPVSIPLLVAGWYKPPIQYNAVRRSRWNENWLGKHRYRRKRAEVSLCPQQTSHHVTWFVALGSRRLTSWAMARPAYTHNVELRLALC
jgi:hypothetical protein